MKAELVSLANGRPVDVIDIQSYGKVDGAGVLNHALRLLGML